uniref:Mitochondrial fission regulator n=1 Tax=Salmo trutta TaxID=8032 RepID=A0A673Y331_SALTR
MSKESPRIDMDLAFGFSGKAYGSSRSIVRRIATNLPLKPCPRVHFQLDPYTEDSSDLNSTGSQNGLLASLADVFWIDEEEKNDWFGFGRLRSEVSSGLMFRSHPPQPKQQPLPRRRSLPRLAEPEPQGQTRSNDEAIQKISALETELAELRAQIAQIVLTQEQNTLTEHTHNTHILKGKEESSKQKAVSQPFHLLDKSCIFSTVMTYIFLKMAAVHGIIVRLICTFLIPRRSSRPRRPSSTLRPSPSAASSTPTHGAPAELLSH